MLLSMFFYYACDNEIIIKKRDRISHKQQKLNVIVHCYRSSIS